MKDLYLNLAQVHLDAASAALSDGLTNTAQFHTQQAERLTAQASACVTWVENVTPLRETAAYAEAVGMLIYDASPEEIEADRAISSFDSWANNF